MPDTSRTIYHYTCDHGARGIHATGVIKPNPQPILLGLELAWFTDLDLPIPDGALGMARAGESVTGLTCDRYAHRFTVAEDQVTHWPTLRRTLLRATPGLRRHVETLEEFAMPMHWWVAESPVSVVLRRGSAHATTNH